jgi:hypothetical protein
MITVNHQHHFAFPPETDEKWEVQGRYDAVEFTNGKFGVWSAASDKLFFEDCSSFDEANKLADAMARAYRACEESHRSRAEVKE